MERRLQMVKKDGVESRPTPRRRECVEAVPSEGTGQSDGQSLTPRQTNFERSGKSLKRYYFETCKYFQTLYEVIN